MLGVNEGLTNLAKNLESNRMSHYPQPNTKKGANNNPGYDMDFD